MEQLIVADVIATGGADGLLDAVTPSSKLYNERVSKCSFLFSNSRFEIGLAILTIIIIGHKSLK